MKNPEEEKKDDNKGSGMKYATLGFQIVATVVIGVLIGQWLDKKFPNDISMYTIICSLVMIGVAMFQVIRALKD